MPDRPSAQGGSRPRVSIGWPDAVRRNVRLVLAPAFVLVALAVVGGLARDPTYTSRALIDVGGLDVGRASAAGYTVAIDALAIQYARAVDATAVAAPVERRLHLAAGTVARQVSATPVAGSPLISVLATSPDGRQAMRLADATSASLVRYALLLNSGLVAARQLRDRYVTARRALRSAQATLQSTAPGSARYRSATVTADIALLRAQTASRLYATAQTGQTMTNLLQRLAPAESPTSDRSSVLQQYVAVALVLGVLIGAGLALLRTSSLSPPDRRRALRGGLHPM